jgi:virulence factor Mce-like protein
VRRTLLSFGLASLVGGVVFLALGLGGGHHGKRYWVELDNAFGLINGGDLKVAGVRAGTIKQLKLDKKSHRALVQIEITRDGFGSLRADTHCGSRPQSLIGEYFLDCNPGTSKTVLKDGARIPVTQTSSTIAPDLINDIMRRPYRQRLSIILGELGAGVAGRGADLNAAIRRFSPALRETDRVLTMLANENQTLRELVTNADRVVGDLSNNRQDVARWVVKARDTAKASANRRVELAAGFHKLPRFLEELKPSMAALGQVARNQTPALQNLDASAQRLQELFTRLKPFADASRPAFGALDKASQTGSDAVRKAGPVVDQLASFAAGTPELGRNLALVLEHLDDRKWAVEPDPRSPGGKGYTGLEALLTYVYDQALSTNAYDSNVHYLKVAVDSSDCAHYADIEAAKKLEAKCAARVGPHAPGFNFEDTTAKEDTKASARSHRDEPGAAGPGQMPQPPVGGTPPQIPVPGLDGNPTSNSGDKGDKNGSSPPPVQLPQILPGQSTPSVSVPAVPPIGSGTGTGGDLPQLPTAGAGRIGLSAQSHDAQSEAMLLDYLLGP